MSNPENLERSEKKEKHKRLKKIKEFLVENFVLPKRERDKGFENTDYWKMSPEKEKEERKYDFEKYLKRLNLNPEDLKGKRILDIGCGSGGFVKECLEQDLAEAYGLDLNIEPENIEEKYKDHFFKGSFEEELPLKNFDLILSHGAVEMRPEQEPRKTLISALKAIKENGEIRISPIHKILYRVPERKCGEDIEPSRKKWLEILDDLSSQELINYELRPVNIVYGAEEGQLPDPDLPDTYLVEVLILKKKVEVHEQERKEKLGKARKEAKEAFEEGGGKE